MFLFLHTPTVSCSGREKARQPATNRVYVACRVPGAAASPLSGDEYWNPRDAAAPTPSSFDPHGREPLAALCILPGLAASRDPRAPTTDGADLSSRRDHRARKAFSKNSLK
jgi:hypothetical protein